jgi:hypothetical protein
MLYTAYNTTKTVQDISNILIKTTASNSFIFSGAKGVGKAMVTKELAKSLLSSTADYSANLLWIDTQQDKFSVENIRNIHDFVGKTSYSLSPKIIVIDSIDDLNLFAANALLKLLEEPTERCYFILISHNIATVLKTIRSRCLNVRFTHPDHNTAINIIQQKFPELNERDVMQYSYLAHDIPGIVVDLIENRGLIFYTQILQSVEVFNNKAEVLYDFIDHNFTKETLKPKWKIFKFLIRHLLKELVSTGGIYKANSNFPPIEYEQTIIKQLYSIRPIDDWLLLYSEINKLLYHADSSNLGVSNIILLIFYKIAFKYG